MTAAGTPAAVMVMGLMAKLAFPYDETLFEV